VIRVFLIAASPLARAALQNRLSASVKIVGSAASVDALGVTSPTRRPTCCWSMRQASHPSPSSNRSPTRI